MPIANPFVLTCAGSGRRHAGAGAQPLKPVSGGERPRVRREHSSACASGCAGMLMQRLGRRLAGTTPPVSTCMLRVAPVYTCIMRTA